MARSIYKLLVERAQLALGLARSARQALGGALRAAQRDAGEGEPPEQVIPVAVRREQPARRGEAGLLEQRRQRVELVGEHRRVDHEALAGRPRTDDGHFRAAGLPRVAEGLPLLATDPRTIAQLVCQIALVTTSTSGCRATARTELR